MEKGRSGRGTTLNSIQGGGKKRGGKLLSFHGKEKMGRKTEKKKKLLDHLLREGERGSCPLRGAQAPLKGKEREQKMGHPVWERKKPPPLLSSSQRERRGETGGVFPQFLYEGRGRVIVLWGREERERLTCMRKKERERLKGVSLLGGGKVSFFFLKEKKKTEGQRKRRVSSPKEKRGNALFLGGEKRGVSQGEKIGSSITIRKGFNQWLGGKKKKRKESQISKKGANANPRHEKGGGMIYWGKEKKKD